MFTETEWTTEIARIPGGVIATTNQSTALQFLELLRKNVTGARPLSSMPLPSNDLASTELSEKDIIEGLALEIYMDHHDHHKEPWVVAPERFFNNRPPHLASRLASPSVVIE